MKKILILISYYFPGYRSGGPQQTVKNLVETFGDRAEFYIYTQNHDLGSSDAYEGIECGRWIHSGNSKIMYVKSDEYCGDRMVKVYKEFDIIYSCGLFEKNSIQILRIHRKYHIVGKKIYIAPMGVFSEGALKSKTLKKRVFLEVFRIAGFFNHIIWSFTSELERKEAEKLIGEVSASNCVIAENLPRRIDFDRQLTRLDHTEISDERKLRIVFLSRICVKKNLAYCADILKDIFDRMIEFDIYGMPEDYKYWEECQKRFKELPPNIHYRYCGEVKPEKVVDTFSMYDVFLFPTKGENFGHVIYESLAAGCIPVIANTTPWRDLDEKLCGMIDELEHIQSFKESIRTLVEMDTVKLKKMKENCIVYAKDKYENSLRNSGYLKIIDSSI